MAPFGFPISRRTVLQSMASGFGYLAFSAIAGQASASTSPLAAKPPALPASAKRVIFLNMRGAPSHVDTFDYKPQLKVLDGKTAPGRGNSVKLLNSPFQFRQHGEGGLWISDLFPQLAKQADELCLLRSMHTDIPSHSSATLQMNTGSFQFHRPSLGAWTLYGLGTENQNLPGFVSINPGTANGGSRNYGSAFLPAVYQGTPLGSGRQAITEKSISNIANDRWSMEMQSAQVDFIQKLNQQKLSQDRVNPGIEGVIQSYELAFRMQDEVPMVMDISKETRETRQLYGMNDKATESFGRNCLLARRFTEAGVRFIQVTSEYNWDQHRNLKADLERNSLSIDQPIAGLLTDLKRRDLLKDTLVIWGGEFGRTPGAQNTDGRDHNHKGYAMWMAGGGVKGGYSYGSTDETGTEAVEDKMHVHDWHATILALMGLDHEALTYRHAGRDFRLTDVHGNVATKIFVSSRPAS